MVVGGAAAGPFDVRRLVRFFGDFLAAVLFAARFLVDFLAGLRLVAVFFLGERVPAFFAAVRFLVAISCGSFRFSARVESLVYPLGARKRGETSTLLKIVAAELGRF